MSSSRWAGLDALQLVAGGGAAEAVFPLEGVSNGVSRVFGVTLIRTGLHAGRLLLLLPVLFSTRNTADHSLAAFNLNLAPSASSQQSQSVLSTQQKLFYVLWLWRGDESFADLKNWLLTNNLQDNSNSGAWLSDTSKQRLLDVLLVVDNFLTVLSLVNFLMFLRFGIHRTLMERILRIRIVPHNPSLPAASASFDHMNRELVWRAITEFMASAVVPFINWSRMQRFLRRILVASSAGWRSTSVSGNGSEQTRIRRNNNDATNTGTDGGSDDQKREIEERDSEPRVDKFHVVEDPSCPICVDAGRWQDVLAICGEDDAARIVAVSKQCPCYRYCHYCLSAALLADPEYSCLKCGTQVKDVVRC